MEARLVRFIPCLILCRRLFIGTIAAYLLASLSLGGTRAARPVFYVMTLAWLIFLSRWGGNATRCSRRAGSLRCVELFAFNTALTLVLAEFSLRAFALYSGNSFLVSQTLDTYRLTPGHDYGGGLHGNTLGFPGGEFQQAKRPGIYRIAALGDSFAIGPAVPFADNYLTLLEAAQPDVEVYNFGVSGAGPREYDAILRQYALAFQPDLVLVSIFVGNDITESLATPRCLDPRRDSLYLLASRGLRLWTERQRKENEGTLSITDRYSEGTLSSTTFREIEARRLVVCMDPAPPGLERKWLRALRYLDRMVKLCRQQRVPIACVLIPDEFQVNADVRAMAAAKAQANARSLDLEKPQRRLLAFFAERAVPCLDLLPSFKVVPQTYAPRNTHWNARGNRLAAEQISQWLRMIRVAGK
jgi:hypothetical protein